MNTTDKDSSDSTTPNTTKIDNTACLEYVCKESS